jgi:hypothetical protein
MKRFTRKNNSMDATVEINGDEVEVEVEYHFASGTPATMYSRNGDPGDPEEPDEVDIQGVYRYTEMSELRRTKSKKKPTDISALLDDKTMDRLVQEACALAYRNADDDYAEAMESARDAREDR